MVHPSLSFTDIETNLSRVAAQVNRADYSRSILEQIDERYDLLVLDWGLERPDARGILDAFRQNAPETQILVIAGEIPPDDPVDRGADELLTGPFSDEALYSTIERLLLQKEYEAVMDEFFRLSTERALLESELQSGLNVANQYQSLVSELYDYRERAASIRDELSGDEFNQALRQLLDE